MIKIRELFSKILWGSSTVVKRVVSRRADRVKHTKKKNQPRLGRNRRLAHVVRWPWTGSTVLLLLMFDYSRGLRSAMRESIDFNIIRTESLLAKRRSAAVFTAMVDVTRNVAASPANTSNSTRWVQFNSKRTETKRESTRKCCQSTTTGEMKKIEFNLDFNRI